MSHPAGGEGPAVLQLQKWGPSGLQLDLSEFQEAFISPTRELLLLLSYQCHALLLPLITGDLIDTDLSTRRSSENHLDSDSPVLASEKLLECSGSDPSENIPSSSGSGVDLGDGFSSEHRLSKANKYPILCDVNSLAWGVCGDAYDQHNGCSFREFLFVSGKQGVTVHAFRYRCDTVSVPNSAFQDDSQEGKWVEWGPSPPGSHNTGEMDPTSLSYETTGNVLHRNNVDGAGNKGIPHKRHKKSDDDYVPATNASNRWLQSFLTKAETTEYEGHIWTRFPDKSSFPSSAKVVSFSIFDDSLSVMGFLGQQSVLDDSSQHVAANLENGSCPNSELPSSSVSIHHPYKCVRVFSSNSHQFLGFVLTVYQESVVVDEKERNRSKNTIIVARINVQGIQWTSCVKLDETVNECHWSDFCFSNDLLVCLNAFGLIFFYDAASGEFVASLDVALSCGLNCLSASRKTYVSVEAFVDNKAIYQDGVSFSRRKFRRLLLASYTSLLGVVDDLGVVYVISAREHVPDKYYTFDKFLPHYKHLGLGMLVGWKVAGSDIGSRRIYSKTLRYTKLDTLLSESNGRVSDRNNIMSNVFTGTQSRKALGEELFYDSFSNDFPFLRRIYQKFHDSQRKFHLMREVFFPVDRVGDSDSVCFSPFGITRLVKRHSYKEQNAFRIVHFNMHVSATVHDDSCFFHGNEELFLQGREEAPIGEAVGGTFQGLLYLVTEHGLSVVLPSISIAPNFLPVESIGYRQPSISLSGQCHNNSLDLESPKRFGSPSRVEILDRVLLYDGPEEADRLCLENGWDLKISRMRRLQMALDYLKFDEIKPSLEGLVEANIVEEGILRLLFAAAYLMFKRNSNDNEISAASRLLGTATWFSTKMIRKYGLRQQNEEALIHDVGGTTLFSLQQAIPDQSWDKMGYPKLVHEIAHYLEIIRNLQHQLTVKLKKPSNELVVREESSFVDHVGSQDEYQLSMISGDHLEMSDQLGSSILPSAARADDSEKLALVPKGYQSSEVYTTSEDSSEASALVPQGIVQQNRFLPLENPKDMIARWKIDKLDLKTVVKDALLSGRLPLAVLQLHLHRSRELLSDEEPLDTFTEVSDIGRAIAYDLFLKGETGLAIATLQRLGEDVEMCLKELVFGTLRRSVRAQIAHEMIRYGYLGPRELKILERISLIERSYPSSSFSRTFLGRQQDMPTLSPREGINLQLLDSHLFSNLVIECGEVDGVVLGSWRNISENIPDAVIDEDGACSAYWAAAAVWSSAWDQRTIDRILLDQPFLMGVHVLWESQVEYYLCHNDWEEVSKLLDFVPVTVLSEGSIQVALDGFHPASTVRCISDFPDDNCYICSVEQLDAVCMDVPGVKIIKLSPSVMCCSWLGTLLETVLAKKIIFLKEFWEGTGEIVSILARSGFVTDRFGYGPTGPGLGLHFPFAGENLNVGTLHALDKLVVYHCVQNNLPNLLEVYLNHHKLALDDDSLSSLLDATGDCHWARWLLLSRIKGHEYDASFENTRTILSHNSGQSNNLRDMEVNEIIHTIDDIAEGGGEMAALATLMYAPVPIQDCLKSGSVNRHSSSSAQCTLENLRPTLQHFPTLWRSLLTACFGQDTAFSFLGCKAKTALSDYLNWRDSIFFSSGRDTSLLQMLPCWFPKAVRRLIQLYIQGPLGWQSISPVPTGECLLNGDVDFYLSGAGQTEINAISWEATIQKHVKEELYDSSLEETRLGLEHHLYRGRALAAFNHLLALRVDKLNIEGRSSTSVQGQNNVQSDVQTLLASITQSEESLLASVLPLAITHFEDSVLVASCNFLMELCGLSTKMLQVDIAALRRIASFYKSSEYEENVRQLSPRGTVFHAVQQNDVMESLARALADEYLHQDSAKNSKQKELLNPDFSRQHSRALMLVLQHLEKASLPSMIDGPSCGSWLLTGQGDGAELRSQQKAASQHWSLVTMFCQIHQLPLSSKYLAVLARDNDWVGCLYEAQIGGHPFDSVIQVASKEFSDPCLKIHIMTVLKSMQFRKRVGSSSYTDATAERSEISIPEENVYIPVELFRILAACEKQNRPGEALLIKAKELSWSILAMIASCFPDVPPLPCLTVWLEITAARETSSIKVNNIASKISDSIAAAVESTNSFPVSSKIVVFHYNRRNPKRRRLMDPISESTPSDKKDGLLGTVADEGIVSDKQRIAELGETINLSSDSKLEPASLSEMVAVLCQQHLFLPLLRAFEMFLPSCSLLPFIRALQAFSQMRLSEASAHLGSFSARIKEDQADLQTTVAREGQTGTSWISTIAVRAADAMLLICPSPYEKRCLLQLLAATDFGDGGSAATYYRRLYWKINLAEPSLRKNDYLQLGNETLDDASLLSALQKNRQWEEARNWAKQLEASGGPWRSISHHVTETQAESMVAEWKEFLWDVPEERVALWAHCQTLFIRYSFPALQAGLFFLKHAEAVEKDLPAKELHGLLLLSLQWLSGMITQSNPVYPLHHLREIETRVWLLAVESEAQMKSEGELSSASNIWDPTGGNISNIIDRTADIIMKMDNHMNAMRSRAAEKFEPRDTNQGHSKNQAFESNYSSTVTSNMKAKRRARGFAVPRRALLDATDRAADFEDSSNPPNLKTDLNMQDESLNIETSLSKWEERVGPAEVERAVLSLLEFGQIAAAKQLQQKLSPGKMPSELILVDTALKLAAMPNPITEVPLMMLDAEVLSVIQSYNIVTGQRFISPLQVLESLATFFTEGSGQGLCKKIIAVVRAASILGISFSEAFAKQPIELLQLLSLKAQESFDEAKLLVQSNVMPASSVAQILAESFLKGLLAAHRGGYMDSQKDEGPAPLLWRFSDFLKWAELCPSEPEIGHALMRLVITGQEIPHACEVELLILSHHFYKSSACLDGVDVLVALAATRVEAYVTEGDFPCLARLITGVGNFHALNFILNILIENGQLDLLLQKYSAAADANTGTAEAVRGFRMAVLTSLKQFNPNDLDAFALVYSHFDMKHETAALLELRADRSSQQWFQRYDKDQNEDLLESMRCFIEAAEVHSSIDAGNKTRRACAQASLVSLQIRMPDSKWLYLSETNARRALVDQSRFQEALIVAEAYGLNQPSEWALVLWNLMLNPELTEEFVAEFVAVLPLQPSMLVELAKFYRAEVAARGDQSQFSVWLTGGGLPAEWAKYLGRSFRCLLRRTRDLRLRLQLATIATGFTDVANACTKALDKVPENAGPLVLRKGHGGAYLPLM